MNQTTVREMNAIAERESMFLHDLRAEVKYHHRRWWYLTVDSSLAARTNDHPKWVVVCA